MYDKGYRCAKRDWRNGQFALDLWQVVERLSYESELFCMGYKDALENDGLLSEHETMRVYKALECGYYLPESA